MNAKTRLRRSSPFGTSNVWMFEGKKREDDDVSPSIGPHEVPRDFTLSRAVPSKQSSWMLEATTALMQTVGGGGGEGRMTQQIVVGQHDCRSTFALGAR